MTDEEGIRRTLALYCQYLDARKFPEWAGLFTEDGDWNGNVSRAAILDNIASGALAKRPELRRKHVCTNIIMRVNGGEAQAESDFVMYDANGPAEPWHVAAWGRYVDTLVQRPEGWLFATRKLINSSN
ncbi:MAG TPA: nuclear transport factor 2 family protein [Chloroflexota bacterium]|jgi:3-phenylpropionate/cinnamic acid dioxygenase small subunit|nr:nuclear transport factor 2 family protein [Chloroflexota bacterium]